MPENLSGGALCRNQFTAMMMKRSLTIVGMWEYLIFFLGLLIVIISIMRLPDLLVSTGKSLPDLQIGLHSYTQPITLVDGGLNNTYSKAYVDYLINEHKEYIDISISGQQISNFIFMKVNI